MKKSALLSALSIGVLSISMAFATPAQAVSQVRSNATEVLNILQKANGSNDAAVRRQAETYAMPYFDFQRMTALAVGRGWRDATPEQQKQLTEQFRTLLVRTYSSTMTRFKNAQITVQASAPAADAREVTVRSDVELPANAGDKRSAQVDYTLIKTPAGWRVYNVSIEGASLVTIYRNNFNDILRQGGPDALIQSLKDKNDALSGGKHASN